MFEALRNLLTRWFGPPAGSRRSRSSVQIDETHPKISESITPLPVPYDENLLERARTQWQFGDWESLAKLERDTLQHHPDRAKLALLAAAGRLQTGNHSEAKQFIRLAQDWGVSKKLISHILISGVHNSLGRAAAIGNQPQRSLQHYASAIKIGSLKGEVKLLAEARSQFQSRLLALEGVTAQAKKNQPELKALVKPRLILVAGLNRSGSTWLYNCIRLILQTQYENVYSCWVDDYTESHPAPIHLVKIHKPDEELIKLTDEIYTSRRDIREITGSMMRMGWLDSADIFSYLDWLTAIVHPFWFKNAKMEIDYSEIHQANRLLVEKIGHSLGIHLDALQSQAIYDQLNQLRPSDQYDHTTQLHPNHISLNKIDYKELLGAEKIAQITDRYQDWLKRFGYEVDTSR
jgi:hypothetical protein